MALSQLNAIFLLEDVALILYTLLILKSSQFLFKLKKPDQIQKLVRPTGGTGSAGLVHVFCDDIPSQSILSPLM